MSIYTKFLFLLVASASIIFTILATGCSSIAIRTSTEINASPEEIYAVLADFSSYPDWNPYHQKIEGEFEEGAAMKIYVKRPDGKEVTVPPHMLRIVENEEIIWGGGVKGIFYGEHRFKLIPLHDGKTLLRHDEDFSGIAINFADLPAGVIAEGYQQMNWALKNKIEVAN